MFCSAETRRGERQAGEGAAGVRAGKEGARKRTRAGKRAEGPREGEGARERKEEGAGTRAGEGPGQRARPQEQGDRARARLGQRP